MKLFFPNKHYESNRRIHLFALLKPFIKEEGFNDEDRISNYGISEKDVDFTCKIEELNQA